GQAICGPDCKIQVSQCCDLGGSCLSGFSSYFSYPFIEFGKRCYLLAGGNATAGSCDPSPTPGCPPPGGLLPNAQCGTCQEHAITPVPLCCQHGDGTCSDITMSQIGDLFGLPCA